MAVVAGSGVRRDRCLGCRGRRSGSGSGCGCGCGGGGWRSMECIGGRSGNRRRLHQRVLLSVVIVCSGGSSLSSWSSPQIASQVTPQVVAHRFLPPPHNGRDVTRVCRDCGSTILWLLREKLRFYHSWQ